MVSSAWRLAMTAQVGVTLGSAASGGLPPFSGPTQTRALLSFGTRSTGSSEVTSYAGS